MGARMRMAGLVGRVGYHVARERLLRPRPADLDEVPAGPEALTTARATTAPRRGARCG